MEDYRRDSVYLDFSGMPVRPKLDKVYELISKQIKLDVAKVNCIQPSMTKSRVIIELKSQSYVEQLVAEHSLKHSIEHNNEQYAIPIVPYDNAIEVRVADLPSYVSTETITKYLGPYGEVLSTQDEVWKNFWPGLPTGVRLVRIRIQKLIPSYIPIHTHTAYITYRNQIRTCKYCVRPLHIGRTCNEARKEQGVDINSRLTAAQVVKGIIPPQASESKTDAQPPQSSTPNAMETIDNQSTITNKSLVTAITDRIMSSAAVHATRSRSSSSMRPPLGTSQAAGSSRTSSPMSAVENQTLNANTSDFFISDDADGEIVNTAAPKRHRSPKTSETQEAAFLEVKRKSRSSSKYSSSR